MAYWTEHCFAAPVDPRKLDILLMEPIRRYVIKEGIKYDGRKYWRTALADLVGQSVIIRVEPSYTAPDQIEVFDNTAWVCTALATDSEVGKAVTRAQIAAAQRDQKHQIHKKIETARQALKDAEQEIEQARPFIEKPQPPQQSAAPSASQPPQSKSDKKRKANPLALKTERNRDERF